MSKIDIEEFICSLRKELCETQHFELIRIIDTALEEQSLEYKDGEIVEINPSWSIKDAKPGDIIRTNPQTKKDIIFIFKSIEPYSETDNERVVRDYGYLFDGCFIVDGKTTHMGRPCDGDYFPATKEQRDTLMKAMADAGYKWDAEKKELKKIEQKPTAWSEEDERNLDWLITVCERIHYKSDPQVSPESALALRDWLKSLRPQNTWKPSEEQMKIVKDAIGTYGAHSARGLLFEDLYQQLKKLRRNKL